MARNFGNPDWDAASTERPVEQAAPVTVNETATGYMRDWAAALFWMGAVGLVPPFTVGGVLLMVFGGVLWALCPAVQANNNVMIAETKRTGNGCGWFVLTFVIGVAAIAIAGGLGVGALDMMIAQGMVQP